MAEKAGPMGSIVFIFSVSLRDLTPLQDKGPIGTAGPQSRSPLPCQEAHLQAPCHWC